MPVADKIAAMMEGLTKADIEAMVPAKRERFAFLCSRWANVAAALTCTRPKEGVLASLRDGQRGE